MTYIYSTLENTSVQSLFLSYLQKAKYSLSTKNVSLESFQNMLQTRGYIPGISLGAFEESNHIPVGFILNGFRTWNGKSTVYDILTGTVISHRRQGIANTLFEKLKILLKQKYAEQYLTEVKKDNTPAIGLYKKQGFEIRRGLTSFKLNRENHSIVTSDYNIEYSTGINQTDWERLKSFWEFQPSWQNSISSVNAVQGIMIYALVHLDANIIGYGVINQNTGDIPQLAIHKDYRRKGIARGIVSGLFEKVKMNQLVIWNVDEAYDDMGLFLLKMGFEKTISQYEIVLPL
ncbi:MAG: GNAT family N-acetyltransferase [Dehalococcoidales bacterium]|nr:GNAT family N-acetyltransferase [Dehalococcoidales bacterium]